MSEVKVTPYPDVVRTRDFSASTQALPHRNRIVFEAISPDEYPAPVVAAGERMLDYSDGRNSQYFLLLLF